MLISKDPQDLEFVSKVSRVASLEVEHLESPSAEPLKNNEYSAIFMNASDKDVYQTFEDAIDDGVGLFSNKINANRIHFLSTEDFSNVRFLMESPLFGHFVSKKWSDQEKAAAHYGRLLRLSLSEEQFGLEPFFGEDVKREKITFSKTTLKQQGVESAKNYLLDQGFKSRMASIIANAVDELLMNAMFDAPVSPDGKRIYAQTDRSTEIELSGRHGVELEVAFDGDFVGLSVIDQWGSLDKAELFQHMAKRYIEEEYQVVQSYAGAGIGLATVYRSGGSFLFRSKAKEKTEVTVFFQRTDNFRLFKDQFRFISTQFFW